MSDLQATMEDLRRQMEEKRELQYQMRSLRERRSTLFAEVSRLDNIRLKEQADVTRLERKSLTGLLHRVTGRLEEKREQEQQEADAAAAAHGAALREMQEIDGQIDRILNRLEDLRDIEYRYSKAEQEHKAALKAAGGTLAKEIEDVERALSIVKHRQEENRRILGLTEMCLNCTTELVRNLKFTQGVSAWDALGGGVIPSAVKYEKAEDIRDAVGDLKSRLERLRECMPDVHLQETLPQPGYTSVSSVQALDVGLELLDLKGASAMLDVVSFGNIAALTRQIQELDGKLMGLKLRLSTRQEELDSSYRMFNRRLSELLQKGV